MAKFSAWYQLCPLIDQKNFLGVTDESVNGCVIVTLGKNMVIRYKLSDQKQVSSWSSKDKLSAPVVYDTVSQRYIGVFNANQISCWDDNCVQLNNLMKYKFADPIECVLSNSCSATPVVVFRNGHITPLQLALDKRKQSNDPVLLKDEVIIDAHLITIIGSVTVAIFTKGNQDVNRLHLIPLEEGHLAQSCVTLKRKSENSLKLIGHTLVTYESCQLFTLWSDGQLFSLELPIPDSEQFPGKLLSCLSAISPQHQSAILPLSSSHLAIYGADDNEEGAVLLIFNSQLCVVQCKQNFKLYTIPARLWAGAKDSVLVAAGQFLAVVPFYLGKQRLAALVGSQSGEALPVTEVNWCEEKYLKQEEIDKNSPITKLVYSYLKEGMSQRMISQSLFLPTIDTNDVDGLLNLLGSITDIPESCLVSVISFCLEDIEKLGHRELLQRVLSLPVTADLSTLQILRHKLTLPQVLILLKELCVLISDNPGDTLLIEWATLLLDAHYQQYLLSRDETVIDLLKELKEVVEKQIVDIKVWQQLEPLLLQLYKKQELPDPAHLTNTLYSIEQITLF